MRRDIERARNVAALQNHNALVDDDRSREPLSSIKVPTLVIHGTADPMIALARAQASRDLLLGQGYALEWSEYRMQHAVCPQEIAAIGAWLRRVLA